MKVIHTDSTLKCGFSPLVMTVWLLISPLVVGAVSCSACGIECDMRAAVAVRKYGDLK